MKNRTIALAGVCQAAFFANELATTGKIRDLTGYYTSLESLYTIESKDISEVYGNDFYHIKTGLKTLSYAFNRDNDYITILKYALTMLTLERKLIKRPDLLNKIQKGILDSRTLREVEDRYPPAVIRKLANTYSATVSLLQPRVVLNGKPEHLKQAEITEKIRTILLTGIRFSVLWSQMGGSQWQLLFKRRMLVNQAKELLKLA